MEAGPSHCNTLQHTATHCNTRKGVPSSRSRWRRVPHTATHCNTLQHTATHVKGFRALDRDGGGSLDRTEVAVGLFKIGDYLSAAVCVGVCVLVGVGVCVTVCALQCALQCALECALECALKCALDCVLECALEIDNDSGPL